MSARGDKVKEVDEEPVRFLESPKSPDAVEDGETGPLYTDQPSSSQSNVQKLDSTDPKISEGSIKPCIQCSMWMGKADYPNTGQIEDEDEICVEPSIHEILQSPIGKSKFRSNRNNYYIKTGPKWHYKSKRLLGIWRS